MARGKEAAAAARRREQAALEEVAALKDELKSIKAAAAARESELLGEVNRLMGDTSGEARVQADAAITALRSEYEVKLDERDAYWKQYVKGVVYEMATAAFAAFKIAECDGLDYLSYPERFYQNLMDDVYDNADRLLIDLHCPIRTNGVRTGRRDGSNNLRYWNSQEPAAERAARLAGNRRLHKIRTELYEQWRTNHNDLTERLKHESEVVAS